MFQSLALVLRRDGQISAEDVYHDGTDFYYFFGSVKVRVNMPMTRQEWDFAEI